MSETLERLATALSDRYTVERELGRGGMATVFLAHDVKHDRHVAIKVLGHDVAAQLGSERFLREIKTAAKLNHPNILSLYDSGEADGLLFYVMPYVEEGSLRDRLNREGQLPIAEALAIGEEVAQALHHAHGLGVVHRDIKPENILFLSGRPVLADFGIARAVSAAGSEQLTHTGMAVGTPAYMSPEQAAGDPSVDGRSDIYSLGCVIYEMLSGHPPFMGASPREIIARHSVDDVPPLKTARPTVSDIVDDTLVRALAKVPADRFDTAHDFADSLAGRVAAIRTRETGTAGAAVMQGRVLTIVAMYVVGTGVLWFFARWLADRMALSPHLPSFVLATLGLLLPAAGIVAFTVGNGVRWKAAQTAGVSMNAVIAAVVLGLLFGGKDLGAATVAVALTDEDGNTVERVIPKAEFRKRVAVFYFDADPADSAAQWLKYGIPTALSVDLTQDLFIDQRVPAQFRDRLREAGFRELTDVPLSLKREIAQEQFRDLFVTGTVATEGNETVVTMALYDTESGRKLNESTVRGTNPLELVDWLSEHVRGSVQVPEGYSDQIRDLPAAELLTQSVDAFKGLALSERAIWVDDDWAGAVTLLEAAVAHDPTFALAQVSLYGVYLVQNRAQEGQAALQTAIDHAYRLPERVQNQIKAAYYSARQEQDKAYAVIEMNAELFPTDVAALTALAQVQEVRNQRRDAIATYERILAVDPQQHDFIRAIGGLLESLGEYDGALEYYDRYAALNPTDNRSFLTIGDLHRTLGNHDQATAAYERALLLEPGDVPTATRLAGIDLAIGNFEQSLARYREALRASRTANDTAAAYAGLRRYHAVRGQMREGLRLLELELAVEATFQPPVQGTLDRMMSVDDHVVAGDTARAREMMEGFRAELRQPFDRFLPLAEISMAMALEDTIGIDSAVTKLEEVIRQLSFELFRPLTARARGQSHYLKGEYREALARWEDEQRLNPSDAGIHRRFAEAFRALGEHRRAQQHLEQLLRVRPADPRAHYELGLVYAAMGRREDAVTSLQRAVKIWEPADEGYRWARQARAKLAELQAAR